MASSARAAVVEYTLAANKTQIDTSDSFAVLKAPLLTCDDRLAATRSHSRREPLQSMVLERGVCDEQTTYNRVDEQSDCHIGCVTPTRLVVRSAPHQADRNEEVTLSRSLSAPIDFNVCLASLAERWGIAPD